MDFDDTAEEAAWREECRAFLGRHAEPKPEVVDWGASFWAMARSDADDEAHDRAARAWQRTKFEQGWAGLTWPVEFGGRGLSSHFAAIFAEEEAR